MSVDCDVVVIGAGFGGLYAVHKMRDHLGLRVKAYDAASGPGGTWRWNRYPGARCDIDSVHYSYSFSDEIQRGWEWSERFAGQPELLAYFDYVADKLDVRRAFSFDTRITSMAWNDQTSLWTINTDKGDVCTARFVIAATGNVSIAKPPEFPGAEDFAGELYSTSNWPDHEVEFGGKRVAVVGTGASGVQIIQAIGPKAGHLTVFQRTANYCTPLNNEPIELEKRSWFAQNHAQVRAGSREHPFGTPYEMPRPSSHADTEYDRKARYEKMLYGGGLRLIGSAYADLLIDEKANDMVATYVRDHIRSRVKDPKIAEKLVPTDHPYGTKRPPLETSYYEVFNRENVELVDLKQNPIVKITRSGIQTADGEFAFDMIVFATGFDALTGALMKLGITGRNGVSLNERWSEGPRNFLGFAVHDFPNLFTITGPTSAVALYNNPLAIEDHVDLAARAIQYTLACGADFIEATSEAQDRWRQIVDDLLNITLFPRANSWYMGANVPGKARATAIFVAPAPLYRAFTSAVCESGFGGFQVGDNAAPLPGLLKLDAQMALVFAGALLAGVKPLETCTIEEVRAMVEGLTHLQGPMRDIDVIETTYRGSAGHDMPARIYVPQADGPLAVMLFFHAGGFVAGSLAAFDKRFRALASDLGIILIAPSYSLAPEQPFPAAVDDCYAALVWTAKIASRYGGDPSRLLVAGESAGGNLAAVTTQRARDENGPAILAQVLITPAIDPESHFASKIEFASAPMLTAADADWSWKKYLVDMRHAGSPQASPNRAETITGLPPTLIITAECDPLRDEAEDYGRQLREAGVPVTVRRINGLTHTSFSMEATVPAARAYTTAIQAFIEPLRH